MLHNLARGIQVRAVFCSCCMTALLVCNGCLKLRILTSQHSSKHVAAVSQVVKLIANNQQDGSPEGRHLLLHFFCSHAGILQLPLLQSSQVPADQMTQLYLAA